MALVYYPALWRPNTSSPPAYGTSVNSGRLFKLPQPILNFPWGVETKGEVVGAKWKEGGDAIRGNMRSVRTVSITGMMGKDRDGAITYTDEGMFEELRKLTEFAHSGDNAMELFMYYDLASTTYRKYQGVYLKAFTSDIGDNGFNLYPWTLTLQIVHPIIYTTAPGA